MQKLVYRFKAWKQKRQQDRYWKKNFFQVSQEELFRSGGGIK